MRVHFVIMFSLICGPVAADETVSVTSTTVNQTPVQLVPKPITAGHPHFCTDSYPAAALPAHADGTTTLTFTIEPDSTVRDIRVAKSSNSKILDDAAVECAKRWPYGPMKLNSVPVETPSRINFVWKFPGTPPSLSTPPK